MQRAARYFAVVICLISTEVKADQVVFKNGDRLSGTISKLENEKLILKSELAGDVSVPWDAVEGVSSSLPLYVTLADQQVIVGPVHTAGGALEVQTSQTGTIRISRETIR